MSIKPVLRGRRDAAALGVLLAAVGLYFAVVELREPYYFLWDDNASFYLPSYVHNHDALLLRGEIPHVNYHQYLGRAHLASGQTAALYPPVYLALAIARLGWGDLRPVVDVAAILHFAAAAAGMFVLLRRFGCARAASAGVAFLWTTFPFLVVVARSWIFVAYTAAYLPWGLWLVERLRERPTPARVLALAAVKALFFYQGYVQYWVLATLFEGLYLALAWIAAREPAWRRQAIAYAAAVAAAAALAAPLLVPMLHAKQVSAYRADALTFTEFLSNAMPLDAFLAAQAGRMAPRAIHLSTGAIFYVGVPVLLALAAARRRFAVAAVTALAALVLSTRAWGAMYHVPLLSSFRWPFKSFLVFLFFLAVAVGGAYSALLAARRWRWPGAALLAAGIAGNVAIVASPALDAPFGPNRVDRDVAEIRAAAAARFPVDAGRVASLWMTPLEPRMYRLLAFDYATLADAYHLGGYDPLVARENLELALGLDYSNIFRQPLTRERLDHLSAWSVRYLVLPERTTFPHARRLRASFGQYPQLRLAHRGDGVEVWENAAALPFAFFVDGGVIPVDVTWGARSVRLATAGRGGWLRLNVAPLAGYVWSADGRDMGPVSYAEGRQVLLEVAAGTREVVVRYTALPFRLGVAVLAAFCLSLAALWGWRRRSQGSGS